MLILQCHVHTTMQPVWETSHWVSCIITVAHVQEKVENPTMHFEECWTPLINRSWYSSHWPLTSKQLGFQESCQEHNNNAMTKFEHKKMAPPNTVCVCVCGCKWCVSASYWLHLHLPPHPLMEGEWPPWRIPYRMRWQTLQTSQLNAVLTHVNICCAQLLSVPVVLSAGSSVSWP